MTSSILFLIWVVCAVAGYLIGRTKGRPGLGVALGLILGVIGLVIIALIPARRPLAMGATPVYGVQPGYPPMGMPQAVPAAQWAPDPSGRNQYRWWDGRGWTEHVSNAGITSVDTLTGPQGPPLG